MASPLQFSMRQLLVAVAFVALGITALINANVWWQSSVWMLAVLLLASAILLAIYRRDAARAFWIGFLVFGWIYFGVVMYAHIVNDFTGRLDPLMAGSKLATTRATEWLYSAVIPPSRRDQYVADPSFAEGGTPGPVTGMSGMSGGMMPGGGGGMMPMGGGLGGPAGPGAPGGMMFGSSGPGMGMGGMAPPMIANPNYVDLNTFVIIGHALWLLLLAALGGKLGQWVYRTRPGQESGAGSQGPGTR